MLDRVDQDGSLSLPQSAVLRLTANYVHRACALVAALLWPDVHVDEGLPLSETALSEHANALHSTCDALRRAFLGRLGLACRDSRASEYVAGTWVLTITKTKAAPFVISEYRSRSAEYVPFGPDTATFLSAARTLRPIQQATGHAAFTRPASTTWRRMWWGFNCRDDRRGVWRVQDIKA